MDKNILISGWPGAGVSSVTAILSYALDRKILRGTESFRYIWKAMGVTTTGNAAANIEKIIQPYYGKIYDKYIDQMLQEKNGYIIESDIGGFRVGKTQESISIFLLSDEKTRIKRLENDGRPEDAIVRERSLQIEYKNLHGIDWFDEELIYEKYDYVLNNEQLTIKGELLQIYKWIHEQDIINSVQYAKLISKLDKVLDLFMSHGKNGLIEKLEEKNLIITSKFTIREIKKLFANEIQKFPMDLKNIINKI